MSNSYTFMVKLAPGTVDLPVPGCPECKQHCWFRGEGIVKTPEGPDNDTYVAFWPMECENGHKFDLELLFYKTPPET